MWELIMVYVWIFDGTWLLQVQSFHPSDRPTREITQAQDAYTYELDVPRAELHNAHTAGSVYSHISHTESFSMISRIHN